MQFNVVGLGDKAVAESRERVRAALHAIGLALPGKRLVVNLSPADLPKEGSHFDLPITLAVLSALGIIPQDFLNRYVVMGELALDGAIIGVSGVLPAAIAANGRDLGLICPRHLGPRGRLGGRRRRHPGAGKPHPADQPREGHAGADPPQARRCAARPRRCRTFGTSRVRRPPSGRSKWRRRAVTIS